MQDNTERPMGDLERFSVALQHLVDALLAPLSDWLMPYLVRLDAWLSRR